MAPPFQYENYNSPFANTIAQLLAHQGDPQALAAQQVAAANARAGEISAQAWGGAVQNIAQAGGNAVQQVLRQQEIAPKLATEKIALANLQQQQRGKQYLDTLLAGDQLQPGQEGPHLPSVYDPQTKLYDIPAVTQQLSSAGYGASAADLIKNAQNINDGVVAGQQLKIKLDQQNALLRGDYAHTVLTMAGKTGQAPLEVMDGLVKIGTPGITPDQYAQNIRPQFASLSPEQQTAQLNGMMDQAAPFDKGETLAEGAVHVDRWGRITAKGLDKPMTRVELGILATDPTKTPDQREAAAAALKAAFPQATPTRSAELLAKDAYARSLNLPGVTKAEDLSDAQLQAFTSREMGQQVSKQTQINQNTRLFDVAHPLPVASIRIDQAVSDRLATQPAWWTDPNRPVGPDQDTVDPKLGLSPAGLFQAAQTYLMTGKFPQARGTGLNMQTQRDAILNKVGALARETGLDQPVLEALYRNNAASLGAQQKTADSVSSFMATADRNADIMKPFIDQIPDLNSPYLNKPLRELTQQGLGNVDLAKFHTIIRSVQNEYARIISQPNLSGILTDAAREEAKQLIDPNATVPQILASIQTLKAEGNNRLVSLADQIKTIQARMQNPGTTQTPVHTPSPPPPSAPPRPGYIRVIGPNNQEADAPAGQALPAGWRPK